MIAACASLATFPGVAACRVSESLGSPCRFPLLRQLAEDFRKRSPFGKFVRQGRTPGTNAAYHARRTFAFEGTGAPDRPSAFRQTPVREGLGRSFRKICHCLVRPVRGIFSPVPWGTWYDSFVLGREPKVVVPFFKWNLVNPDTLSERDAEMVSRTPAWLAWPRRRKLAHSFSVRPAVPPGQPGPVSAPWRCTRAERCAIGPLGRSASSGKAPLETGPENAVYYRCRFLFGALRRTVIRLLARCECPDQIRHPRGACVASRGILTKPRENCLRHSPGPVGLAPGPRFRNETGPVWIKG